MIPSCMFSMSKQVTIWYSNNEIESIFVVFSDYFNFLYFQYLDGLFKLALTFTTSFACNYRKIVFYY